MRKILPLLVSIIIVACTATTTRRLSQNEMEAVLHDYHLALALARQQNADSAQTARFLSAVLTKHNITQTDFDSSMIYYMTHADKLHAIYQHLSNTFTNEGRLQGVANENLTLAITSEGDTANIWNIAAQQLLTTRPPDNLLTFHITADSTFYRGDQLIFSFNNAFLDQDHAHSALAALSVRYSNDSVVARTQTIASNTRITISIQDDDHLGIKDIRGFILHRKVVSNNTRNSAPASPLHLLALSDIQLIKMHTDTIPPDLTPADTLRADTLHTDTLHIPPTTNEKDTTHHRPHTADTRQ